MSKYVPLPPVTPFKQELRERLMRMFAEGKISELCKAGHLRSMANTRLHRAGDGFNVRCADCEKVRREEAPKRSSIKLVRSEGYAPGEWAKEALCSDLPYELMINPRPTEDEEDLLASACGNCPVVQQCSKWVSEQPLFEGIAGGVLHNSNGKRKLRIKERVAS